MVSKEIRERIRGIEIYTKRLLNSASVGDAPTTQRGSGFEFDQLREYQEGDDIRFIDWKSSAKMNKHIVRQYVEDKNRKIWLALDVSRSLWYSSTEKLKADVLAEIATVLTCIAEQSRDSVGLIFFGTEASIVMPAKKGHVHSQMIFEKLYTAQPQEGKASLDALVNTINSGISGKSIIIVLSDFIGFAHNEMRRFSSLQQKHACVAIRLQDTRELLMPHGGLITFLDPESGESIELSTSTVAQELLAVQAEQSNELRRLALPVLELTLDKNFIENVVLFFRRQIIR